MYKYPKGNLEYLRNQTKQRFDKVRGTWIECGRWALPHRVRWMLSQIEGERNNHHIVDPTHIIALRSYVAGFLEGNTSASRPWYRIGHADPDVNRSPENREWLDKFTRRTLVALGSSNFYYSAGQFYYDFGPFIIIRPFSCSFIIRGDNKNPRPSLRHCRARTVSHVGRLRHHSPRRVRPCTR